MAAPLAALPQGKVDVVNDPASLVELPNGQPVGNQSPLPSGVVLLAGLYGGTSSSVLYYYPPVSPSQAFLNDPAKAAGVIGPFPVTLNAPGNGGPVIPGIAGGTPIGPSTPWFQVRVWDAAYATFGAALAGGALVGEGQEFQMNPGTITFVPTAPPGPNSTWSETPIYLLSPEPSTTAL